MTNPNDELMATIRAKADPMGAVSKLGALFGNIEIARDCMGRVPELDAENLRRIIEAYRAFEDVGGFAAVLR